ncbi:MAG: ATP phosphoribosyltransferase regulatory subunit [Halanaerobiaceae bacterium]|nr:ATP phosphoribosyltransferase regulatory subunit [Halanaerobiaceae bacterium]
MNNKSNILKSPTGMKAYLPRTALELKELEEMIMDNFSLWGYQPILTPTVEYLEALKVGMGDALEKGLYKFIDYEGNILVLRPEMTAPIARSIAASLNEVSLPLRVSYCASVFRYEEPQAGKNREFYQLGIELLGAGDAAADAEAIILAIESLQKTGLEDFNLDIGHVGFLNGLIAELSLTEEMEYNIKAYLNKRDLVGLNNYLAGLEIEGKELLEEIPLLRGPVEVLERGRKLADNRLSHAALDNLELVYDYVANYGFLDYITFDLGLIRGFDYYTGVVFEGFTGGLGYNLCGGGRYDHLLERYSGVEIPAIGFALGLERIRLALKNQQKAMRQEKEKKILLYDEDNVDSARMAFKLARVLREKGVVVIIGPRSLPGVEYSSAERQGKPVPLEGVLQALYFKDGKTLQIRDLLTGKERSMDFADDWEEKIWENL